MLEKECYISSTLINQYIDVTSVYVDLIDDILGFFAALKSTDLSSCVN